MSSSRVCRAYSLVEVLFGVFLAGVCATILAATMPVADASRLKADLNNKATSLAQKQIEAVRGLGYANAVPAQLYAFRLIDSTSPVATNTYSFTNVDSGARDNAAAVLPSGTGRVSVEQIDLDLRQIVVEVRWVERGRNRSVRLGTLVANL